jgi:hypothetical protein
MVRNKIWASVVGGVVTGTVDHLSALASLVPQGHSAVQINQYLASAVIGPGAAFAGGWLTGAIGVGVQETLTTIMAGVFVAAAQKYPALLRKPWLSGIAYGVLIYIVMNYIAVPLSAAPNWKPPTGWVIVGSLLSHCLYVGVPIAFIARAFLGETQKIAVTDDLSAAADSGAETRSLRGGATAAGSHCE